MEDSSCMDTSVNFNINVNTSESALPLVKAEEPPEEDMQQSFQVVIGTTPVVKTEPMDDTEEEAAQLQKDAEVPSEPSDSSAVNNSSAIGTSLDNSEVPSSEISENQYSISLLWPGADIIKQEPDVEIDHDEEQEIDPNEEQMMTSDGDMSSPDRCCMQMMQDPHPVMILKRETKENNSTLQMVDGREENGEDKEADLAPGLWIKMLNRKAQCLVCNGTCRVTRNRKIPTLPFCKKCKKAYFYQLSHVVKGVRKQRSTCIRGGNCIIDHRFPKEWCSVCHLRKFKAVLMNYAGLQNAMTFENQLTAMSENGADGNGKPLTYGKRQYRYVRRKPRKIKEVERQQQSPAKPQILMEKELVVKVKKLTNEDLEAYGISDVTAYVSTKDEPSDIDWSLNNNNECSDSPTYTLPPLQTKSSFLSSHIAGGSMLLPLPRSAEFSAPMAKKRKVHNNKPKFFPRISLNPKNRENKKKEAKSLPRTSNVSESVASIKVFVFTCGHACGLCNSTEAQRWLKRSGITPTMPHSSCNDVAPHTPNQSAQNDFVSTMMLSSKPESSTLYGSVPHLKELLDRPPEMQFRPPAPTAWPARPPEMQFKQQTPSVLPAKRREKQQLKRTAPLFQRPPMLNPSLLRPPHPAFPGAVRLRPDVPSLDKSSIPGHYHLLPIRFAPPLPPPQGPLLLRVPTVSTAGNLQQGLPSPLPPAPASMQLNAVQPIPPINAPLSALQQDVRLALAKSLTRPTLNLTGNMQAPSVALVPPPISLIPVPGNLQLQKPMLVSAGPDFSQPTSKTVFSSQASAPTSQPLLFSSSKSSKEKLVSNSMCVTNSGPTSSQKKRRLQTNSYSSLSYTSVNHLLEQRPAKADTIQRLRKTQPSAGTQHTDDSSADKRYMSEASLSSPLEHSKQVSVEKKHITASPSHLSDGGNMVGSAVPEQIVGALQLTDHIQHTADSLQPEPSDDMECSSSTSSQQLSLGKKNSKGLQEPSDDMDCPAGLTQPSDGTKSHAGSTQHSNNVDCPANLSQLLNDMGPSAVSLQSSDDVELTGGSPAQSNDNDNTAVSLQTSFDERQTTSLLQPSSDKEHTVDSQQTSSDIGNSGSLPQTALDKEHTAGSLPPSFGNAICASSPQTPFDKEHSAGSLQQLSDKEHTASSSQQSSDEEHTAGSMQPSYDKEHTASSLQQTSDQEHTASSLQKSSDEKHTAGSMQLSFDKEHTASSLQQSSDEEHTAGSMQPSFDKEHTASSLQQPSDKEYAVSSLQPSSDKEHTASILKLSFEKEYAAHSSQPSFVKEHTAGSPQSSSVKEHTAGSPEPSSVKEHTTASPQPSSIKEHTAGSPQPSSVKEHTAGSPQPSSVKEHTAGSPQPSPVKEHTADSLQPSSVKEYTVDSPQLSSTDNEQTNSQPLCDKQCTEVF